MVLNLASAAMCAQPALSDAARRALDGMCEAHHNLGAMTATGTICGNFNVAGVARNEVRPFTTSFLAPGRFLHDVKDELLVGSDGKQVYALNKPARQYVLGDVPPTGLSFAEMPANIRQIVSSQDPSLALALSRDPMAELMQNVSSADVTSDQDIEGRTYPAVLLTLLDNRGTVLFAMDPQSRLPRRVTFDVAPLIARQGVGTVTKATITVDYANRDTAATIAPATFVFEPPAGARLVTSDAPPSAEVVGTAKEGQAAPDFELAGPDGAVVKLSSLKGSVVLLDFWATWCGPCVASLPDLQAMHDELGKAGVKFYAVNEQEEAGKVKAFLAKRKIMVPVLMDTEGKVGAAYGASAIPYKVLIDKQGVVRLIKVGFEDGEKEGLLKKIQELIGK